MATTTYPTPFVSGFRLIDGNELNSQFANPKGSSGTAFTAFAGGGQTSATQITQNYTNVTTVATAADSVKLPENSVGRSVVLANNGAAAMQVFGYGSDTVNGIASGTGFSQPAGTVIRYTSTAEGSWFTEAVGQAMAGTTGAFSGQVSASKYIVGTETGSTTTNMSNGGLSNFGDSAAHTYTLNNPVAGVIKYLHSIGGSTAITQTVVLGDSTVSLTSGTGTSLTKLTFTSADACATLIGNSAAKWILQSTFGTVTATS